MILILFQAKLSMVWKGKVFFCDGQLFADTSFALC